jgi:uncharacterized protein
MEDVAAGELGIRVEESLRIFLRAGRRDGELQIRYDGASSLGHVVQSLGIPLPEVGQMRIGDSVVPPSHRPHTGDLVEVQAASRPQPLPSGRARFALDVHLGSLARRLRLLGLDSWYVTDVADEQLVYVANTEDRVLLTKDRGLLCRRTLRHAAYVRGSTGDDQVADVLDRFAPPLAPFTRCTACNGILRPVAKSAVANVLKPGTARSYDEFAQCSGCGQVYWRGAHAGKLDAVISAAGRAARRGGRATAIDT